MYILAIDTTGPVGTVCLADAERGASKSNCDVNDISAERGASKPDCTADGNPVERDASRLPMKVTTKTMSHLKNLVPMIDDLMSEQGVSKSNIAAVAASCGPGSFTGIRIGVSTARALAQAWDVPCISVPTLEMFRLVAAGGAVGSGDGANNEAAAQSSAAAGAGDDAQSNDETGTTGAGGDAQSNDATGTTGAGGDAQSNDEISTAASDGVCVILNARRGQVYGACFGQNGETIIEPGPYMLADMLDTLEAQEISPVFYGDGVDAYFDKDDFAGRVSSYRTAPVEERYQTAETAAKWALIKYQKGETIGYGELLPDYMRESEAEQRLKDGSLEKMRKEKLDRLMRMAGK